MNVSRQQEYANPVAALDGLPFYRRLIIGLAAAVSGLFAAIIGVVVLHATHLARRMAIPWLASTLGLALLTVAVFMTLVWLRLWFGPREWLDRTINRLFFRAYFNLVCITFLLEGFAAILLVMKR